MRETRFIVAGSFIDGTGGPVRKDVLLTVTDAAITGIGPAADLPGGAAVDDLSHGTVLPALVDCSVDLTRSGSVDDRVRCARAAAGPEEKAALVARHGSYCHAHGVLGVAATDDPAEFAAGGGKGGLVAVRAAGVDFLRIELTGSIEEEDADAPRLTAEGLRRILAGRGDRKAVVVANGGSQVAVALAAGCDAIEQGYAMGEENLREMAARGVLWIPGVLRAKNGVDGAGGGGSVCCRFSQRYLAPGKPLPGAEAFWKKTLAGQLGQLRLAKEFGVATAIGTGAGSEGILHGEAVVEEMKLFIKAGFPLVEAIRCASTTGAAFFGMAALGPLAVGRPATFLVTRGAVHQLPRKLGYLEGIYINGAPSPAYRKNPVRNG